MKDQKKRTDNSKAKRKKNKFDSYFFTTKHWLYNQYNFEELNIDIIMQNLI